MITYGECEEITTALLKASAVGARRLQAAARETLLAAGVEANADPVRLGARLQYRLRPVIARPVRRDAPMASIDGRRVAYRWDPDVRERNLNALVGIAMARIAELGLVAGRADSFRLAAYLAMPADSDLVTDLEGCVLPRWFVIAHHEARATLVASTALRLVAAR